VFVNPRLTPVGDATAEFNEGCLSVRGYRARVRRHLEVRVEALDRAGQRFSWQVRCNVLVACAVGLSVRALHTLRL